jgi:hypothetical protein
MNNTSNPKRLAIRIRDGAAAVYKLGLKLMAFAVIGQFAFAIVIVFGFVIWDAKMLNQVNSVQSVGPAQIAGMQPDGHRAWVQTSTGLYFLRPPTSIAFGEEVTVQTRGEGSRYLCSRSNGCTLILSN